MNDGLFFFFFLLTLTVISHCKVLKQCLWNASKRKKDCCGLHYHNCLHGPLELCIAMYASLTLQTHINLWGVTSVCMNSGFTHITFTLSCHTHLLVPPLSLSSPSLSHSLSSCHWNICFTSSSGTVKLSSHSVILAGLTSTTLWVMLLS